MWYNSTMTWGDIVNGYSVSTPNPFVKSFSLENLVSEIILSPHGLFGTREEQKSYLEELKSEYDDVDVYVKICENILEFQEEFEIKRELKQKEASESKKTVKRTIETRNFDGMKGHVQLAAGKKFMACRYICYKGVIGALQPAEGEWGEGCTDKMCKALHPGDIGWNEVVTVGLRNGKLRHM